MSQAFIQGLEITSLHFSYYDPTNHGVVFKIKGKVPKENLFDYSQIKMNLHGSFWKYLPLGLDKVIKWTYLPMYMGSSQWKKVTFDNKCSDGFHGFLIEVHLGTKENGQFGISRKTLYQELKKISTSVKSVLEIEFLYQDKYNSGTKPFFSLFTTPPLIFESLENHQEALFQGKIPDDIRSQSWLTEGYEYFRWWFLPTLFLVFLMVSCCYPETFLGYFPKVFFTEKLNERIEEKLAPCPETLIQSWNVSRLEYEYSLLEKEGVGANFTRMNEILMSVAGMVGRSFVDKSQIHLIYQEILNKENEQGISTRITGLFNFINIIWLVAIIGIVISLGPCLYTVLKPLRKGMWELAILIWHHVIIPLHSYGILELFSYYICMVFVTEGFRYVSISGFYIGITGLFGSFAANIYTLFLRIKVKPNNVIYVIYNLLFSMYMVPMAIYYQSLLLGWLSVLCFYQAIGFSFICCGLCYYIGFHNEEAMIRVSITSTIVGIVFIVLKYYGVSNYFINPFASALTIFSANLLLLALLIFSSYFYEYDSWKNRKNYYIWRQIPMIGFLLGFLFFGNLLHMVGLVNTATVYLVFYFMEKYCDLHYYVSWNIWVLVFIFSAIIYKAALYLHEYPEILFSMFNYNTEEINEIKL